MARLLHLVDCALAYSLRSVSFCRGNGPGCSAHRFVVPSRPFAPRLAGHQVSAALQRLSLIRKFFVFYQAAAVESSLRHSSDSNDIQLVLLEQIIEKQTLAGVCHGLYRLRRDLSIGPTQPHADFSLHGETGGRVSYCEQGLQNFG